MKMRKYAGIAALVIAALGAATGTAGAAPAQADAGAINYSLTNTETDTVVRTDAGSLVVENGVFKVKAADGSTVAGTELSFRVDDFVFPIAAQIKDRTATLTPQFDQAHAVYQPVALPYENQAPWKSDYDREVAAWTRLTSTISAGATIGTLVGGIGGAALGCVLGAGVAVAATAPLALLFGTGPLGGCVIGASLVGFLGTVAGQIFVTAPVAILAAAQYFTTINQPSVTPAK
ncbi:hypothetical protein GFY24_00585 [Nocardia sp. SYP-A9097]|uniref:hypothetical protein n=1 Tax=Nocardia sp. SYP-A9097 TaxID=2663237 RepID=UPI00129A530F|nr:hypothetical protein [Nocardia sp. SYP-A9097]MRH85975.1 hypothetical protein [Nocardia sp. SYP-A9097]